MKLEWIMGPLIGDKLPELVSRTETLLDQRV